MGLIPVPGSEREIVVPSPEVAEPIAWPPAATDEPLTSPAEPVPLPA